jgi:hypothetical protein
MLNVVGIASNFFCRVKLQISCLIHLQSWRFLHDVRKEDSFWPIDEKERWLTRGFAWLSAKRPDNWRELMNPLSPIFCYTHCRVLSSAHRGLSHWWAQPGHWPMGEQLTHILPQWCYSRRIPRTCVIVLGKPKRWRMLQMKLTTRSVVIFVIGLYSIYFVNLLMVTNTWVNPPSFVVKGPIISRP